MYNNNVISLFFHVSLLLTSRDVVEERILLGPLVRVHIRHGEPNSGRGLVGVITICVGMETYG